MKKAYFAGGCFWCMAPIFRIQKGVLGVESGYSGGDEKDPRYEDVKAQKTGHRESVCVTYDENLITYDRLLEIYLANVDPFDPEGQFIDKGRSYTLAVFTTADDEVRSASAAISRLEQEAGRKSFISIEPFKNFYPAEAEHQDYDLKHPEDFEKEIEESGRKAFWSQKE